MKTWKEISIPSIDIMNKIIFFWKTDRSSLSTKYPTANIKIYVGAESKMVPNMKYQKTRSKLIESPVKKVYKKNANGGISRVTIQCFRTNDTIVFVLLKSTFTK